MLKTPVNIKSCIIKEVRATITKSFDRPVSGVEAKKATSHATGDNRSRREKQKGEAKRITEGKRESA